MTTTATPAWASVAFPTQARSIGRSASRIIVWTGAIRSGKTISSLPRWLQYVANEAPKSGELFMVGRTTRTIEHNLITPLQDPNLFGDLAAGARIVAPSRAHARAVNDTHDRGGR